MPAWGCKKELVVQVADALRAQGIEVWRDEEGSALLGPMGGDVNECMARAIELSHTVVICGASALERRYGHI
jgi:hypothetical protein